MTRDEFKEQAEEFARMYVSDYAMVESLRVVLDEEKDHEEGLPTGSIEFKTCFDDEDVVWSVPICVGGKDNDQLEVYIEDSEGYELDPQNFYVYLWSQAATMLRRLNEKLQGLKKQNAALAEELKPFAKLAALSAGKPEAKT